MAERAERVEIGFRGGQVVATRLEEKQLKGLLDALGRGDGWYDLDTEDGPLALERGQVSFVRVAAGEHRVGFLTEG
jgi:hypothetical protein